MNYRVLDCLPYLHIRDLQITSEPLGGAHNMLAGASDLTHWGLVMHKCASELSYRKVSNIRRTLVGDEIVDHSDVVGASPVGAAPTTSSFST